jgi:hypothetical protein
MGRILVLLTFAGLAAVFVIIYNTTTKPVQSAAASNSNASAQGNRRTKPSQLDKKGRTPLARTASEKGNKRGSKAAASRTDSAMEGTVAAASKRDPVVGSSEPTMTVKSDSTPVYSANSKRSKVLRSLRRGEKVLPDLEVIDSEGRWRVVRGQKDKPGFVREEQIERRPDDASSKNKPGREQSKQ